MSILKKNDGLNINLSHNNMACNHAKFLFALKESTKRDSVRACHEWMRAKESHPLYNQLSETRTTQEDRIMLQKICLDIEPLHQEFIRLLSISNEARMDYYDCF